MGQNKGSFITTLLVMFVLFLSLISIVFNLKAGRFAQFEIVLLILLLLKGISLTLGIAAGKNRWKGLIKFYMFNWVNLLLIYFMTYGIKQMALPFIITGMGFLIAITKAGCDVCVEEAPVENPKAEKKVAKKTIAKKTTKKAAKKVTKKPAKKKPAKKKTSKKK